MINVYWKGKQEKWVYVGKYVCICSCIYDHYFDDLIGNLGSVNETLKQTIDIIHEAERGILILVRDSSTSIIQNYLSSKERSINLTEEEKQSELRIFGMGAQILSELGVKDMVLLTNTDWKFVGLEAYGINIIETKFLRDLK